ncbi:uncharacterized protein LOC129591805 isoform X2 [Paramacrobiotus metropolitanus]|uniref:uncharacterized protein LOC129591805 isoform X2 n=1 Tax=Paramacrobiotus metropolitanus TaxID=2943436 RepID=UPI0024461FF0|nr:uncharacterized protein LOC129591805 isoform X2 [Paramacrobiotus metropolitanus]
MLIPVSRADKQEVFSAEAYLLFYMRMPNDPPINSQQLSTLVRASGGLLPVIESQKSPTGPQLENCPSGELACEELASEELAFSSADDPASASTNLKGNTSDAPSLSPSPSTIARSSAQCGTPLLTPRVLTFDSSPPPQKLPQPSQSGKSLVPYTEDDEDVTPTPLPASGKSSASTTSSESTKETPVSAKGVTPAKETTTLRPKVYSPPVARAEQLPPKSSTISSPSPSSATSVAKRVLAALRLEVEGVSVTKEVLQRVEEMERLLREFVKRTMDDQVVPAVGCPDSEPDKRERNSSGSINSSVTSSTGMVWVEKDKASDGVTGVRVAAIPAGNETQREGVCGSGPVSLHLDEVMGVLDVHIKTPERKDNPAADANGEQPAPIVETAVEVTKAAISVAGRPEDREAIPSPAHQSDVIGIGGQRRNVDEANEKLAARVKELERLEKQRAGHNYPAGVRVDITHHLQISGQHGGNIRKLRNEFQVEIQFPQDAAASADADKTVTSGLESQAPAARDKGQARTESEKRKSRVEVPLDSRIQLGDVVAHETFRAYHAPAPAAQRQIARENGSATAGEFVVKGAPCERNLKVFPTMKRGNSIPDASAAHTSGETLAPTQKTSGKAPAEVVPGSPEECEMAKQALLLGERGKGDARVSRKKMQTRGVVKKTDAKVTSLRPVQPGKEAVPPKAQRGGDILTLRRYEYLRDSGKDNKWHCRKERLCVARLDMSTGVPNLYRPHNHDPVVPDDQQQQRLEPTAHTEESPAPVTVVETEENEQRTRDEPKKAAKRDYARDKKGRFAKKDK